MEQPPHPAPRPEPGTEPTDPFLWLEEIEGERALAWVRERNRESTRVLEARPEFAPIRDRLRQILDEPARIPQVAIRGGRLYNFWRDAEHPRGLWRRTTVAEFRRDEPRWELLLDLDALAREEGENWVWGGSEWLPGDDRHCLVYLSPGGGDAVVTREFDAESGTFPGDGFRLPLAKLQVAWRDRNHLWVATDFGPGTLTRSGYARCLKLWRRGTPLAAAELVFRGQEEDVLVEGYSLARAEGRYDIVRRMRSFFGSDYYLRREDARREAGGSAGEARLIKLELPPDADLRTIFGGWLLVSLRSDWEVAEPAAAGGAAGAAGTPGGTHRYPQDALLAIELEAFLGGSRHFQVLFEPTPTRALKAVATTRDCVLMSVLDNVRGQLYELRPPRSEAGRAAADTWERRRIPLPGPGQAGVRSCSADSGFYLFGYADFLTPPSLWLAGEHGAARAETTTAPQPIKSAPAHFDARGMEVTQRRAISADGTAIPYFLVTPPGAGAGTAGQTPTLLYGYGGFEVSMTPDYMATLGATWLERGGALAIANIRGGGEFGPRWHQAALKSRRQKSFDDFIAVAEALIAEGVCTPNRLGIMGGSNGGLLVGAVMTQRPELFGAVVCQMPLLDMRRYHKLLAGASWMAEYGDPDQPEEWAYIRRWSPYHNVRLRTEMDYPEAFFTTSTQDDRVHPGHARKMVARLRALGHPVLYYEETEGGHATVVDHAQAARAGALRMSYLWMKLGAPGSAPPG